MPKSKYGPALFEVYNKASRTDPKAISKSEEEAAAAAESSEDSAAAEQSASVEAKKPSPVKEDGTKSGLFTRAASALRTEDRPKPQESTQVARTGVDDDDTPPLLAVDGGYLRINMNSRAAGLTAFCLLLVMCLFFAAGKWWGWQQGHAEGEVAGKASITHAVNDDIARARESDPVAGLFEGIGQSPVSRETSGGGEPAEELPTRLTAQQNPQPRTPWVKGNTYVVIQAFRGDARQDAEQAQAFMSQNGVESVIIGSDSRGYKLISSQGFDRSDETQKKLADRHMDRIRAIGKDYFESGGRYRLEGYFATLTTDKW